MEWTIKAVNFAWYRNLLRLSTPSEPRPEAHLYKTPSRTFQNTPVCKPNLVLSEITTESFPPPPRWPEFFFLFSVSLGTLGGFSSKEDLSDTLTESRGSLPFSMTGVKPTDNERSCAEMAKNSDVVRVASDEEAARVINFPVITRCRPTIYFSLHLFPIRPKHAPPFCPLSAFTDR